MCSAIGKIELDVEEMNLDLMSISGHKIYAPKGVGALYIRRKPRVRISAIMSGGGQERGMRSGTLSPALCVGLGEAAIYSKEMKKENKKITKLKDRLLNGIRNSCSDIYLTVLKFTEFRNLNLSFAYIEGESLMMGIKILQFPLVLHVHQLL